MHRVQFFFLLTIAIALLGLAGTDPINGRHAAAGEIVQPPPAEVIGQGRLIARGETDEVLRLYESIPGGAKVTGDGRLVGHEEAHQILRLYNSMPGLALPRDLDRNGGQILSRNKAR